MRYVRIFLLNFERVFQYRSRIFVWFLISLFHPLIYLMFWKGRAMSGGGLSGNFTDITTYYLLFIIAGGFFVHVEGDAQADMVEGGLSAYLIKPMSYLGFKFFSELPWRLIQGFFGLIALLILVNFLRIPINLDISIVNMYLAISVAVCGYLIMFLFKMLVLLSALWVTDIGGFQQLSEMLTVIFAGFIMPIRNFPAFVSMVAYLTPFPYMLYYPVIAFQGRLGNNLLGVVGVQLFWIFGLYVLYKYAWKHGVKKFTAVGI